MEVFVPVGALPRGSGCRTKGAHTRVRRDPHAGRCEKARWGGGTRVECGSREVWGSAELPRGWA